MTAPLSALRRPGLRIAIAGVTVAAASAIVVLLERRRALRTRVEPTLPRTRDNLAMGAIAAVVVHTLESPIAMRLSRFVEQRRWGIVMQLGLPRALERAVAIVLMDYALYWWHIVLHRIPLLWRMHLVHHIDRDMDASTALRFHFAELVVSIPVRLVQYMIVGARPSTLRLWQALTLAEVVFHHANIRLPIPLERVLSRFVVTPRLHWLHHDSHASEAPPNYSSGLTLWDSLHRTLHDDMRERPLIGVEGYLEGPRTGLVASLALPLTSSRVEVPE